MHLSNGLNMTGINNVLPSLALLGNHYNKQIDEPLFFLSQDVRITFRQTPSLKDTILTSYLQQLAVDYYVSNGISVKLEKYGETDADFINYVTMQTGSGNPIPVILGSDKSDRHSGYLNKTDKQCLLLAGVGEGAFTMIDNHVPPRSEGHYRVDIDHDDFFSMWDGAGRLYFSVDHDALKKHNIDSSRNESVMRDHSFGFFNVSSMAEFVFNIPYCYTELEIKMYLRDVCNKIEYSCVVPTRTLLMGALDRIERDNNSFVFTDDKYKLAQAILKWKDVSRELSELSEMPKTECFSKTADILCNIAEGESELRDSIREKVNSLFFTINTS